jgi:hypothetical protein
VKRIAASARLYSGAQDPFGTKVAQDESVGSLFKLSHYWPSFLTFASRYLKAPAAATVPQ